MKKILVFSLDNAGRSQMAEGWLKYYGKDKSEVVSAGLKAGEVSPFARKAMSEAVMDISRQTSLCVDKVGEQVFDFVICFDKNAMDECPDLLGDPQKVLYQVPDPAKEQGDDMTKLRVYRAVCNAVEDYCFDFIQNYVNK